MSNKKTNNERTSVLKVTIKLMQIFLYSLIQVIFIPFVIYLYGILEYTTLATSTNI